MIILYLRFALHAPWCRSLKDKRSETKRLIARIRAQFNISVCEVGAQDLLARIELGVAALAFDRAQADSMRESITAFLEGSTEAELLSAQAEYR